MGMEAFLREVILEGVRVSDFIIGGGVVEYYFTVEEDGTGEVTIFLVDCRRFTFNASF